MLNLSIEQNKILDELIQAFEAFGEWLLNAFEQFVRAFERFVENLSNAFSEYHRNIRKQRYLRRYNRRSKKPLS